ncbi:ribonuclease domain-containing protein [[Erwinia] mediterraneensis]|uniref:ribonuclease domain-containing protein n=1 Tax=[Erwinia] mediterraneensis TaxID=2161819 RepID=UPI001031CA2B|nr:ribonuclease domain-containing protein [[Erwinia] mediterraneensis]
MSKKLWIGLVFILAAGWAGLKPHFTPSASPQTSAPSTSITALTEPVRVASWLQQHHHLPDYYISKNAARRQGWDAAQGNLCDVLPGKAIGGDRFANREGRLPEKAGRQWFEADVNYRCGHRNADRLLYSSDGLIFLTTDHYRSFKKVP